MNMTRIGIDLGKSWFQLRVSRRRWQDRWDRRGVRLCPRQALRGRLGEEAATRGFHRGPGAQTTPTTRPDTCVQPTSHRHRVPRRDTEAGPLRERARAL